MKVKRGCDLIQVGVAKGKDLDPLHHLRDGGGMSVSKRGSTGEKA